MELGGIGKRNGHPFAIVWHLTVGRISYTTHAGSVAETQTDEPELIVHHNHGSYASEKFRRILEPPRCGGVALGSGMRPGIL